MPEPRSSPAPSEAFREGLLTVAQGDLAVHLVEAGDAPTSAGSEFAARFPARYLHVHGPGFSSGVAERARDGSVVFATAPVVELVGALYPSLVAEVVRPRVRATLVGVPAPSSPSGRPAEPRDDLQAFRGLPSTTVVAPADGPTLRSATVALAGRDGPAYLRLPPPEAPPLTDGAFAVGRAPELRAGSDLALIAYGPPLALALAAADELARVGLSIRVLDVACLKPLDEGAILRAARDTGALLVLEEAPVATGIGTLVAAMTAENSPVPVRRLGRPDLWEGPDRGPGPVAAGLTLERVRDEAWELLRLRGRTA
jgi:transketolase